MEVPGRVGSMGPCHRWLLLHVDDGELAVRDRRTLQERESANCAGVRLAGDEAFLPLNGAGVPIISEAPKRALGNLLRRDGQKVAVARTMASARDAAVDPAAEVDLDLLRLALRGFRLR